jgi:hypothetical protein
MKMHWGKMRAHLESWRGREAQCAFANARFKDGVDASSSQVLATGDKVDGWRR